MPIKPLLNIFLFVWQLGVCHADCWSDVEQRYAVSKYLLLAIAQHESGLNALAIHHNSNGSDDIGLMQINSAWLPVLKAYGIGLIELREPCINLNVGAWILANNFAIYGNNWRAVGAYNAKTEFKRVRYAQQVAAKFESIANQYGLDQQKTSLANKRQ